jgi:hypothetical protein
MSELKPCPLPNLPEGYWEDEDGDLWIHRSRIAFFDKVSRSLITSALEHDFPALAIWLQRRTR